MCPFCNSTGTAAASRLFNEALAKIAVNAQQGGTTDIGECLRCLDDIVNINGYHCERASAAPQQ